MIELNSFTMYADGSVSAANGSPEADGGVGWIVPGLCFGYGYVPPMCTNNISEMLAVIAGASQLIYRHRANQINFVSDSSYVVNGFNLWLDGWHRKGYAGVKNDGLWRKAHALKKRVRLTGRHIPGHNKAKDEVDRWYNAVCDHLAHLGRTSEKSKVVYIDDDLKTVLSCHQNFYLARQEAKARNHLFSSLKELALV